MHQTGVTSHLVNGWLTKWTSTLHVHLYQRFSFLFLFQEALPMEEPIFLTLDPMQQQKVCVTQVWTLYNLVYCDIFSTFHRHSTSQWRFSQLDTALAQPCELFQTTHCSLVTWYFSAVGWLTPGSCFRGRMGMFSILVSTTSWHVCMYM